mmetsp:Transcript_13885/g.35820  ORF Transcript_13885/g.35820 Transcript_13885/m.35820 type:complete len:393 (-) Transcript_13885:368-1546(-)
MRPIERSIAGTPALILTSLASDATSSSPSCLPLLCKIRRVAAPSPMGWSGSLDSCSPNASTMKLLRVVMRTVTPPPARRWKGLGCSLSHTSSSTSRHRLPRSRRPTSSRSDTPPRRSSRSRSSSGTPSISARRTSLSCPVRSLPNSSQKMPSWKAVRTIGSRASQTAVVVLPRPAVPAMPVTELPAPTMPTTTPSPRTPWTRASRRAACSGRGWKWAGRDSGTSKWSFSGGSGVRKRGRPAADRPSGSVGPWAERGSASARRSLESPPVGLSADRRADMAWTDHTPWLNADRTAACTSALVARGCLVVRCSQKATDVSMAASSRAVVRQPTTAMWKLRQSSSHMLSLPQPFRNTSCSFELAPPRMPITVSGRMSSKRPSSSTSASVRSCVAG